MTITTTFSQDAEHQNQHCMYCQSLLRINILLFWHRKVFYMSLFWKRKFSVKHTKFAKVFGVICQLISANPNEITLGKSRKCEGEGHRMFNLSSFRALFFPKKSCLFSMNWQMQVCHSFSKVQKNNSNLTPLLPTFSHDIINSIQYYL